jgi:hypothetical protein
MSNRLPYGHGTALHFEIDSGVPLRHVGTGMSQPGTDRSEFDPDSLFWSPYNLVKFLKGSTSRFA